ncbi:MAG: aminotransferase class V-fold PLP-dependent enzyme [Gammaproteobacteria bacterium]|nr:aminotransferase class V-fold PLP-dependent enzyme [Gammaproteobacteria bacterium]
MMNKKIRLDIEFVKQQFPYFHDPCNSNWVLAENAGGTLVSRQVIEQASTYLSQHRVQPYARYPLSQQAGALIERSKAQVAQLINAAADELVFNASSSQNSYMLSHAFENQLQAGDEIIVTNQDHETNIGFWRRMAESVPGVVIKTWQVAAETGTLHLSALQQLISPRTRLLFFTQCSNIIGEINSVETCIKAAHDVGAWVVMDGVACMPHQNIDVKALDIDFYFFSLYKLFGPHVGVLYGKKSLLMQLKNQGHYFNDDQLTKRLCPSGPQYSEIASSAGIVDYLLALYHHHFPDNSQNLTDFAKISQVFELIKAHETSLITPLLNYLRNEKSLRVLGDCSDPTTHNKVPIASFVSSHSSSQAFVTQLIARNIATNNHHFYAKRLLQAVGINPDDGVIRLSLVHYNRIEEVNRIISAIDESLATL